MSTDKNTATQKPTKKRGSRLKVLFYLILVLAVTLGGVWLFGTREPLETTLRFDPVAIGDDLDTYLANEEAKFADIKPGQQKEIVWAYPSSKARTPVSLIYVHGFSASRLETAPLTEQIAGALNANVFYSRLTGHGRSGTAMGEPTAQDWLDDTAEALEIGNQIGQKTVAIGVSTGGTLAAIAAMHPDMREKLDAIVFISPNFRLKAPESVVLTFPFARSYIELLVGENRGFEPINEMHGTRWTTTYPSVALLPMAAAVQHSRSLLYERTEIPALFIFSERDTVIDAAEVRSIHDRWGGPKEIITVDDSDDPFNHVLAGDALSPSTTDRLGRAISAWLSATLEVGG
ncbi:MAG: alpha/beta fold hydrolase [Pseudomonadota bacterium]